MTTSLGKGKKELSRVISNTIPRYPICPIDETINKANLSIK
jgi:hypothetical protein